MTSLLGDLQEGVGVRVAASKALAKTAWGPELRAPGPISKATWRAKLIDPWGWSASLANYCAPGSKTLSLKKLKHPMTTSGLNLSTLVHLYTNERTHACTLLMKIPTTHSSLRSNDKPDVLAIACILAF